MSYREVGALWLKRNKTGKQFLDGYLQTRRGGRKHSVKIVQNNHKTKPEDPDYIIYRSRARKHDHPGKPRKTRKLNEDVEKGG